MFQSSEEVSWWSQIL